MLHALPGHTKKVVGKKLMHAAFAKPKPVHRGGYFYFLASTYLSNSQKRFH